MQKDSVADCRVMQEQVQLGGAFNHRAQFFCNIFSATMKYSTYLYSLLHRNLLYPRKNTGVNSGPQGVLSNFAVAKSSFARNVIVNVDGTRSFDFKAFTKCILGNIRKKLSAAVNN